MNKSPQAPAIFYRLDTFWNINLSDLILLSYTDKGYIGNKFFYLAGNPENAALWNAH